MSVELLPLGLVVLMLVYAEIRVHRMYKERMSIIRGQLRRYEKRAARLTLRPGVLTTAMTEEPGIAEKLRNMPPRAAMDSDRNSRH